MIHPTAPLPLLSFTSSTPNLGLAQVRRLQARLNRRVEEAGHSWLPITAGPFLVPVLRNCH